MNVKDELRQLIYNAQPLVDKLESPATTVVCDKLRKIHDKLMELSINMPTKRKDAT